MRGWRTTEMRVPRSVLLVLLFALGAVPYIVHGESQVSFQEIEESLTCQCGCGLTVHSCNHVQCSSALPLREEIRAQMKEGKDKAAILAHFRDKYGEKILSAPTTEGFNILAWVTPFALVGLGGIIVVLTVVRWRRRSADAVTAAPEATDPKPIPKPLSDYDKLLERELKSFDG